MPSPELAANTVLDDLGIRGPEDLRDLDLVAWARGALVRYRILHGSEARISIVGKRAVITVSSLVQNPQRRRFSVAHELGHLEMHQRKASLVLCLNDDLQNWLVRRSQTHLEVQANEFASSLLLPERFFAARCKSQEPSIDHIAGLAAEFDTSLTATAIRYNQFNGEPTVVIYSQGGLVKWFRPSPYFEKLKEDLGIYIETSVKLKSETLATRVYRKVETTARVKRVQASAWFASGQFRSDARIQEQCISMPRFDAVLSLLWVNEEIEEDSDLW